MRVSTSTHAIALAVLTAAFSGSANAASINVGQWTPIFQGIDAITATVDASRANALRIDLSASGISFTTTPHSGPLETTAQTTSQFLVSSGTQVAINAGFFDPCCTAAPEPKNIEGLAVSNGSLVSPNEVGRPVLLLTKGNRATIAPSTAGALDLTDVYNAVAGSDILVLNGIDVAPTADTAFNNANPRSSAGLSLDGRYLFLAAIDGRQPGYSVGTSLVETAGLMLALGSYEALNLDGGGSTALVAADGQGGAFDLNRPSGGRERYNGNNLGVYADALPVDEPAMLTIFGLAVLGMLVLKGRQTRDKAWFVTRS